MSQLQTIAEKRVAAVWQWARNNYNVLGDTPRVVISNRLKTTAGLAYMEDGYIKLSAELFEEYTQHFVKDTIPHEILHIVAWKCFGDMGHGIPWKQLMQHFGLPPNRCHYMTNSKWETRKLERAAGI